MNDFLTWFLHKHFLIAAVMFPELAFAYAVWMKWTVASIVMAAVLVIRWLSDTVQRYRVMIQ